MTGVLDLVLRHAVRDGVVSDADVLEVRRTLYGAKGELGPAIRLLWEADQRRASHSDEWSRLFVEAAVTVALEETPPRGYFPPEKARAVMEALGEKSEARADTVLEALVTIVEKANHVPADFSAFVLRKLKSAVIYADGPSARGEAFRPGAIGEAELSLIRRCVWGAGEEGALAVSRAEAEALFDIADATAGADNAPGWEPFFAGAVGNYLIGATGRQPPSRDEAFQLWETDYKADVIGFLSRAASPQTIGSMSLDDIKGDLSRHRLSAMHEAGLAAANRARETAMREAERLRGDKADWIVDRIRRNGALSGPESALVRFLDKEATQLPQELRAMVAEAKARAS